MDELKSSQAPSPKRPGGKILKNYAFGTGAALLVIAAFVAGVFLGELRVKPAAPPAGEGAVVNREAPPPYLLKDVDFNEFWQIWRMVKERHVSRPVSDIKMFYGSIGGMVASLKDPYSVFLDPELAKKFAQELEGTFEGIGAEIGIKKEQLTIIAPLAGTPAEKAGLKAGDRILAIDEVDTAGMLVEDAVMRIRGPKGTKVKLLIMREGFKEPKDFIIARATIVIETVKWKMAAVKAGKIAVLTVTHFNEITGPKFDEAVRAIIMEDPDGLVLDLRNNPGGFLDTAVDVAGEWVPKAVIVTEKFSDGTEQKYASDTVARLAGMPTVVLVNGGSASASEIVAGALQDYAKAKVVGETTYGKGSVQDYSELEDGSALKLTVALWYTPKGRSIDKEGIAPDFAVKMTPEDYEADKDPQMDKALEILTSPQAPSPP